jgi:hypothetical protein
LGGLGEEDGTAVTRAYGQVTTGDWPAVAVGAVLAILIGSMIAAVTPAHRRRRIATNQHHADPAIADGA